MIDIKLDQIDFADFDLSIENSDLSTESGLQTAVILSLFTDRRVDASELPKGDISLRGWWGDLLSSQADKVDQFGSRLWLLARQKRTVEVLSLAEEYAGEALTWLVDDGLAESINVVCSYNDAGALIIEIKIYRPAKDPLKFSFAQDVNTQMAG